MAGEGEMFLSLSTSSSLILSIIPSLSISHLSSVSISHLNQVFRLPSVVIQSPWQLWQPWATEQQEPTVGCLFSVPPLPPSVSSVSIWSCSLSHSLFSSQMQKRLFHLVSSHLSPCVVWYILPSISHSFVSFVCHSVCLSVCQETVLQQGGGKLAVGSCRVPGCQTYQSCALAYLPVSDDDKRVQLV